LKSSDAKASNLSESFLSTSYSALIGQTAQSVLIGLLWWPSSAQHYKI